MDTKFSRNLIKGKIAEIIFEQMFREAGEYTVIPFGYENIMPELSQCKEFSYAQKVIDNVRNSPDFALISRNREKVFLVEVKYRRNYDKKEIGEFARLQAKRWRPSWIFIATLSGFYFDSCSNIEKNGGLAVNLSKTWINKELQKKYLELLKEFEK